MKPLEAEAIGEAGAAPVMTLLGTGVMFIGAGVMFLGTGVMFIGVDWPPLSCVMIEDGDELMFIGADNGLAVAGVEFGTLPNPWGIPPGNIELRDAGVDVGVPDNAVVCRGALVCAGVPLLPSTILLRKDIFYVADLVRFGLTVMLSVLSSTTTEEVLVPFALFKRVLSSLNFSSNLSALDSWPVFLQYSAAA